MPSPRLDSVRPLWLRVALVALGPLLALWPTLASAQRPNIVLLLADDLGFSDLGSYGSEIETPNLDRLAARGLRLSNFHAASSCAPTRAMLLTGVDSHRAGVPNIVEAIPPEQREHPHYQGSLGDNVATLAERLRDAGYHTYMAGKWHLGHGPGQRPFQRGFERTFMMADTGSDNWEEKPYLPIYRKANWYADGEPAHLPDDFYSSKFFIDKTLEFIDGNASDGRPFFAYVAFQAVHIPVQAPRSFTAKYLETYSGGWSALREARFDRALRRGVVPAGTRLKDVPTTRDWQALAPEERRYRSKAMAVYAGMIDAMDFHIGRLVEHLELIGEYENTVFIFLSDNGAEASDPIPRRLVPRWLWDQWLRSNGYNSDYETLGERGSFMVIGPGWASAAASPLDFYKFFSSEGGTRVPLIISGAPVRASGRVSHAFAWVTDVFATIIALAGADAPAGDGRNLEVPTGRSLLPILSGESDRVYGEDEPVGYELGGNAALFKGDHKLVLNRPPLGDGQWHLYDIAADPGETTDLAGSQPERFASMRREYAVYVAANHVLPVPEGYDQRRQVVANWIRSRLTPLVPPVAAGLVVLLALLIWRRTRRA